MKRKLIIVFFVISLFTVAYSLSFVFADSLQLKIHFIDIGEGDSILIETPEAETILIDTGNLISGSKVMNYLNKEGIKDIDHLILTHPHFDHVGGAFFLLQTMPVKQIYDNGQDLAKVSLEQDIYRWYEEIVRQNSLYKALAAGDELLIGELRLQVIWPPYPSESLDFNVNSLVIMVKYGTFRCLLEADLTATAEQELLKRNQKLKADVLKVAHHGAVDSSSRQFLKKVFPKIAIISVNQNNIRGYPSPETLSRLKELGSKVYRTDRDGTIVLRVDKQGKFWLEREK